MCFSTQYLKLSLFSPNMPVKSSAFLVVLPTGVHQGSRCDTFCEWCFGPHLGFCWGWHDHSLHLLNEGSCHSAQNLCTSQSQKHRLLYFKDRTPCQPPTPLGGLLARMTKRKSHFIFYLGCHMEALFNAGLEVKRMCWITNMSMATWWAFPFLLLEASGFQRDYALVNRQKIVYLCILDHYCGQKCHAKLFFLL